MEPQIKENMKLILGTMNFGPQVNEREGLKMLTTFLDAGFDEIDSAYVYNEGVTEEMLGSIFRDIPNREFKVATKVNPRVTGKLDKAAINLQITGSLERMAKDKVQMLYLHMPDPGTPIEETLEACHSMYEAGKFSELGLSNFPAWMVVDIWHICDKRGWVKPTVYQGLYNAISRKAEKELFPALRRLGMRFYAFNPLAGGLLTGKQLNFNSEPESGRFARLASYRNRYWKKSYFDAVNLITKVCTEHEIHPAQAAYRWLAFHSCLDTQMNDAIIIGASTMEQFNANLQSLKQGHLSDQVLEAFDAAWHEAINESPDYFYFYKD